jgi:Anti-sigma-28 factor, FlgM
MWRRCGGPIQDLYGRQGRFIQMDDRQRKVMELKERIARDDYRVDPEAVAAAIVARILRHAGARRTESERVLVAQELLVHAANGQA